MSNGDELDDLLVELGTIMERRVESVDDRMNHLVEQVEQQLASLRRDVARMALFGLLGSVVCTALLCLGTIVLLL